MRGGRHFAEFTITNSGMPIATPETSNWEFQVSDQSPRLTALIGDLAK